MCPKRPGLRYGGSEQGFSGHIDDGQVCAALNGKSLRIEPLKSNPISLHAGAVKHHLAKCIGRPRVPKPGNMIAIRRKPRALVFSEFANGSEPLALSVDEVDFDDLALVLAIVAQIRIGGHCERSVGADRKLIVQAIEAVDGMVLGRAFLRDRERAAVADAAVLARGLAAYDAEKSAVGEPGAELEIFRQKPQDPPDRRTHRPCQPAILRECPFALSPLILVTPLSRSVRVQQNSAPREPFPRLRHN